MPTALASPAFAGFAGFASDRDGGSSSPALLSDVGDDSGRTDGASAGSAGDDAGPALLPSALDADAVAAPPGLARFRFCSACGAAWDNTDTHDHGARQNTVRNRGANVTTIANSTAVARGGDSHPRQVDRAPIQHAKARKRCIPQHTPSHDVPI